MHKETREKVYTNCDRAKCQEILDAMLDKDNYGIAYKWLSI
jgi:hypothetical protein